MSKHVSCPYREYRRAGIHWPVLTFAACLLTVACARLPTSPVALTVLSSSPNFDDRHPNYVIIHQTSNDNVADALKTLTDPTRKVSAHYLIGRDGTLHQLVDESRRAWHAGISYWGGNTDLNSSSIGIELDNNGEEAFAEAQIDALLGLLRALGPRYRIPTANYLGHGDIAPRRKVDPSRHFPWQRLAREGFGLWCTASDALSGEGPLDGALALQALGYDVTDPAASLRAFRRHFGGEDSSTEITEGDQSLLRCLLREKLSRLSPGM